MSTAEKYIDFAMDLVLFVLGLTYMIVGFRYTQKIQTQMYEMTYSGSAYVYSTTEAEETYSGAEIVSLLLGNDTAIVTYGGLSYPRAEHQNLISHINLDNRYIVSRNYTDNVLTEIIIQQVE